MKFTFLRTTLTGFILTLTSLGNVAHAGLITTTHVSNQYLSIPKISGPDASPETQTSGPASEFPSVIDISELHGIVTDVNIRLIGFSHTYPSDLYIGLVNPFGVGVFLMADAGAYYSIFNINLTFDDQSSFLLGENTRITHGTYQVAQFASEHYMIPARAGSTLADFNGMYANGLWSLYIYDNSGADVGSLQGWELTVTTTDVPEPSTLAILVLGMIGLGLRQFNKQF